MLKKVRYRTDGFGIKILSVESVTWFLSINQVGKTKKRWKKKIGGNEYVTDEDDEPGLLVVTLFPLKNNMEQEQKVIYFVFQNVFLPKNNAPSFARPETVSKLTWFVI